MHHQENFAEYLLAAGRADSTALVAASERLSYADLRSDTARVGRALDDLDPAPGSRIAIAGPNSRFWVASYLAVLSRGCIAVPLSDKLGADEFGDALQRADAAAVLSDRRSLRRVGWVGDQPVRTEEILDGPPGPGSEDRSPSRFASSEADALWMFTSGTTAEPKIVRITHANLIANTESILGYLELTATDRALAILPFHYCYGASVLHTHLRAGAGVVLCNSFAFPQTALDLAEREGCTVFAGVPASYQLLLRASTFAERPLPALRIMQQAGGRLSPELIERVRAAQPGARLFVMYGQTEATARLSYLPPDLLDSKRGSSGRGIAGVTLSVLDEQAQPVAPGTPGEIYATGPNISPGYVGDPEASSAKFTPHGLRTGDIAVVDDDGFITIVDRASDFIKSWGYRISSHEVEQGALATAGVESAAAVGIPDPDSGEAVILFVTGRPGIRLAPAEVKNSCGRTMPRHLTPRDVHVLDQLPLTASGKVAKAALRQLALNSTTRSS